MMSLGQLNAALALPLPLPQPLAASLTASPLLAPLLSAAGVRINTNSNSTGAGTAGGVTGTAGSAEGTTGGGEGTGSKEEEGVKGAAAVTLEGPLAAMLRRGAYLYRQPTAEQRVAVAASWVRQGLAAAAALAGGRGK
ncbi:hypothetical protein Agub_g15061 [Astrephomene gubernaculifera]|uniref:Uncharacterized protein n=1 Tax=Astrephomene gubernaculifera TaxID=47775 RepID=A0AAD3HTL4_9CHLO|nr:hypothetical protein Agub_g15061 [Astrephomene gubernaculifera]